MSLAAACGATGATRLARRGGPNFGSDKGGVPYCDSVKNPYVYSQTAPDIFRLMQTVDTLGRVSPEGYGTTIEVMSSESFWPLPWYLRRFQQVRVIGTKFPRNRWRPS